MEKETDNSEIKMNKCKEKEEEISPFDSVMQKIGYDGKFQKRFSLIFNVVLVIVASLPFCNLLLLLAIPEHWCFVPGRNYTNFSEDEWKNITLPKENDSKGQESFSKCKMYEITDVENYKSINTSSIISCQYGWEFDRTWYAETIPSAGEWVCDKELFVSNAFATARIGDVIGTIIFGQMGDIIGRKPVFLLTFVALVIGRIVTIYTTQNYRLFLIATFLGNLCAITIYQSPVIIAMEMSDESQISKLTLLQCVSFAIGFCLMPIFFWFWNHWYTFAILSLVPCVAFTVMMRWMIESPKWLVDRGKVGKAIEILKKIAKVNGTKVPDDAIITLRQKYSVKQKAYGFISLFSNWRITKNTILLLIAAVKDNLLFGIVTLNITNLGGNPFLNVFFNGIAEVPALFLSRMSCDYFGRRWSQAVPNIFGTLISIVTIFLITNDEMSGVVTTLAVFLRFVCAFVFYATYVQTLEIYPTCIRQSGLSLGFITGSIIGVFVPYLVYLGTAYDARYPIIILSIASAIGSITALFLPETLHQKLPETLADTMTFGADQKFWSFNQNPERKLKQQEETILNKYDL